MPFTALGLHPAIAQATREMRYSESTPVQGRASPVRAGGGAGVE
jgi:hypothetical protein